jgi:hypothetical protein
MESDLFAFATSSTTFIRRKLARQSDLMIQIPAKNPQNKQNPSLNSDYLPKSRQSRLCNYEKSLKYHTGPTVMMSAHRLCLQSKMCLNSSLFRDLNTASCTEGLLDVTVDGKLTSGL